MIKNIILGILFSISFLSFGQTQNSNIAYEWFPPDWELSTVNTSTATVGSLPSKPIVLPNGNAGYQLKIDNPGGDGGLQPNITVAYSSSGGSQGILGVGFNLQATSSITRVNKTEFHDGEKTPVQLTTEDRFTLDGMRLYPIQGVNGYSETQYKTEVDNFSKIESKDYYGQGSPERFIIESKTGTVSEYGLEDNHRLVDNQGHVLAWFISRVSDQFGNEMLYNYETIDGETRIHSIHYNGGLTRVHFEYKNRHDRNTTYNFGKEGKRNSLLYKINVNHAYERMHSYEFIYSYSGLHSYLTRIKKIGQNGEYYNPTVFQYDDLVETTPNQWDVIANNVQPDDDVRIGDFNGDGLSDYIKILSNDLQMTGSASGCDASQFYIEYIVAFDLYINDGNGDFIYKGQSILNTMPFTTTQNKTDVLRGITNANIQVLDLDGDGKSEVFTLYSDYLYGSNCMGNGNDGTQEQERFRHKGHKIHSFNGSNMVEVSINTLPGNDFHFPTFYDGYPGNYIHVSYKHPFIFSDFNKDGKLDYAVIHDNTDNIADPYIVPYPQLIVHLQGANQVLKIDMSDVTGLFGSGETLLYNANKRIGKIQNINWDQSSKYSHLIFQSKEWGTTVAEINIDKKKAFVKEDTEEKLGSTIGDFNGDGLTDILHVNDVGNDFNLSYSIVYGSHQSLLQNNPKWGGVSLDNGTESDFENFEFLGVSDMNSDGLSDILIRRKAKSPGPSIYRFIVLQSLGNNTFKAKYFTATHENLTEQTIRFSDFDGDGKVEIGNRNVFLTHSKYHLKKLKKIGDGYGYVTHIDYKKYSDSRVYKPALTGLGHNTIPMHPAGYLVSQIRSDNGLGGEFITQYQYKGLHYHRKGKGGIGFEQTVQTDLTNNIRTISLNEFYAPSISLRPKRQTTYFVNSDGTTEELSRKTHHEYHNFQENYSGRTVYLQFPKTVVTSDFFKGGASVQKFVYSANSHGNVSQQIAEKYKSVQYNSSGDYIPYNSSNHVNLIERVTENYQYVLRGTWIPASLAQKTRTFYRRNGYGSATDGNETITKDYDYYSNGLMKSETFFVGTPKEHSSHYVYTTDGTGLLAYKYSKLPGISQVYDREGYTYDSRKRLISVKNALNYISYNEYYDTGAKANGLKKKTGFDGKYETYTYDGLGILTLTTPPQGGWFKTEAFWDNTVSGGRYKTVESGAYSSITETYYDRLNRVIKTKTQIQDKNNPSNGWSIVDVSYNDKGLKSVETKPYKPGTTIRYHFSTYDKYNRLVELNSYTNHTANVNVGIQSFVHYNKTANDYTIQEVQADGSYKTKTYDFAGKLMSVTDAQTSISHRYYKSNGMLYETVLHGSQWQQRYTYDLQGNIATRDDRSIGLESYVFDSFGQLTSKTDAYGEVTTYTYDLLRRPLEVINSEGRTVNSYKNTIGSNGIGEVESIIKYDASNILIHRNDFVYDGYSNLLLQSETIEGQTSNTAHSYDIAGRLLKKIHGDGIEYEYTYDPQTHFLDKIAYRTSSSGVYSDLYEPITYNADGAVERYKRFGNIETIKDYTASGILKSEKTGNMHHLEYTYDRDSQNYTSKFNVLRGKGERFTHSTDLDQLLSTEVYSWQNGPGTISNPSTILYYTSSETPENISYDNTNYGNIVNKSFIGTYNYSSTNPHQLNSVTQASGIANTHMLKVLSMESSVEDKPLSIAGRVSNTSSATYFDFKLGLGDQRIRYRKYTGYNSNASMGSLQETKYYFDGYESLEKANGDEYKIHYIGFGNGLEFVFKNKNNSGWDKYVVHKDYQGTILKLTDESGNNQYEQNFDVWGRRRYFDTWTFDGNQTDMEPVYNIGDNDGNGGSILAESDGIDTDNNEYDYYEPDYTINDNISDSSIGLSNEELQELNTPPTINQPLAMVSQGSGSVTFDDDNVGDWFRRGYTGHEHFEEAGVIHMNARLYDPMVGRMLSADKALKDANNSQNYNRYAYALNNPTKYTDPSGNIAIETAILIGALIGGSSYAINIAMSPGGFDNWDWAHFGGAIVFGAVGGAVTSGIGSIKNLGWALSATLHGVAQTALSIAQGMATYGQFAIDWGNAALTFISSFASSAASTGIEKLTELNKIGVMATQSLMVGVATLVGGLTQSLGGGSFLKGATSGFMISLLNHVAHMAADKFSKRDQTYINQPATNMKHRGGLIHKADVSFSYKSLLTGMLAYFGEFASHAPKHVGSLVLFVNGKFKPRFFSGHEWISATIGDEAGNFKYKIKAYRLGKLASQFSDAAGIIGTGFGIYDIYQGKANFVVYADTTMGLTGIGTIIAKRYFGIQIPVVGQAVALYGTARLTWDSFYWLGGRVGPSKWYGTDDHSWFK